MKVIVTLTALNEAGNIDLIIKTIIAGGYGCILVDDGSTDNTQMIAASLGATVIRHAVNLGQGYAVLTGFKAALMEDCDIIVEMDADGQHDPSQIHQFIEKLESTSADIVVGSRILGTNYDAAPFFRRTFLPHVTWIINRLSGYHMTDAMCGFRAFRKTSLLRAAALLDDMLEPQYLAAEMFLRFAKTGLTVAEVPINLKERSSGKSYKGLSRYGFGIIKAITRVMVDKSYRHLRQP